MEEFFEINDLQDCVQYFSGLTETEFFALTDLAILNRMGYSQLYLRFIDKFHVALLTRADVLIEVMDCNDIETPAIPTPNPPICPIVRTLVHNDLYDLLNTSLRGKIILGTYKKSGEVDEYHLKEIFVTYKMQNSMHNRYSLRLSDFQWMANQTTELFPVLDPKRVHQDPYFDETGKYRQSKGFYINYYKTIQRDAKFANVIELLDQSGDISIQEESDNSDVDEEEDETLCLTDANQHLYSINQKSTQWEKLYDKRVQRLTNVEKKKKTCSLESYFEFSCLQYPTGLILLEQDFNCFVKKLASSKEIPTEKVSKFPTLFCDEWPKLADKIVSKFDSKNCKNVEIKNFLAKYDTLKGVRNDILALFLISLSPGVKKTVIINKTKVNLTKQEISKCFILHVEKPDDLSESEQSFDSYLNECLDVFETWFKSFDELIPYLVFAGPLDKCKAYLHLNGHLYPFEKPLEAVQSCYKCLTALHAFPSVTDFPWGFIHKAVYGLDLKSIGSFVRNLIEAIGKIELPT